MSKIDLKKENKEFYYPSTREVAVVEEEVLPQQQVSQLQHTSPPGT